MTTWPQPGTVPDEMRYKKSETSISHIVQATMRVLARQGYAHTSLMDIAREAGMSKGAVHYHFPTKEELMTVVLRAACEAVAERTRRVWTAAGANPFEALRSSLDELWRVRAELSDEIKVVADLLAQSVHDDKLRTPLAEYYRFATAQVREHVEDNLQKMGVLPKLPPEMLARLMHALLDGLLMQRIVDAEAIKEQDLNAALAILAASFFEPTKNHAS